MSTKKKKSESRAKLPDGSTIREYETEETHPDGTRVITTTTLRSYDKIKTLQDGSQVKERVNTTTTTTKECQKMEKEPNVLESAVNAVGGFLDMFNPKCAEQDEARDDEQSRLTAGTAYTNTSYRKQHQQDDDDAVSTLGWNPTESRLSADSDQVALRARHSTRAKAQQSRSREAMNATQKRRGSATAAPAPTSPAGFFQKTHPSGTNHQYQQPNHNYHQHQQPSNDIMYNANAMNNNLHECQSVDNASFALYETDRCEQLPTFHKVVPDKTTDRGRGRSVGRSIIRSMTPTRTYSTSSNAQDVNRNIKLGISSKSKGRGKGRSRQRQRDREDPNVLDPEVVAAIGVMRDRSKSPVDRDRRGRSRNARQGQREVQRQWQAMRASQQFDREAGQRLRSLSVPRDQPQAIARQATPTQQQQQATTRQSTPMQQYQSPTMMSPTPNPMYNHSPQQQYAQQTRTGTVHRGVNNSIQYLAQNNPPLNTVPRTPNGGGAVDFDGLPLGNLRNPIPWDDVSEIRDDSLVGTRMGAGARSPVDASPFPASALPDPPSAKQRGQPRGRPARSKSTSRLMGRSTRSKDTPTIPPPTRVKYSQCLLPSDFAVDITPPKIAVDGNNAVLTSDKFVHFYSLLKNKWTQTTTVSLQNTHRLSLALSGDMAVIGVPYDRNSKGLLTGSAYIFERDPKTHTWYQVKKIVPKRVQEYATVGYSVDICDGAVVVGVPELGLSSNATAANGGRGGGGSVYVYRRSGPLKWSSVGHLTMNNAANPMTSTMPLTSRFGTIVAMRSNMLVVSNYQPDDSNMEETSLFVYEYDATSRSKWRLIQTDLLSTEGQRRNFGSRIVLTRDGEGLFIGCHSKVNPTEILYYRRQSQPDVYGNRGYDLRQIITVAERCDVADFSVDENDTLILGTVNSNRVYIYQQMHDLATMEHQGWRMMSRVVNGPKINGFGSNVGISGDSILVGTTNNVYSYSLEGWMAKLKKGKQQHQQLIPRSKSLRMRSSSPMGRGFMSSVRSFRR